MKVRLRGSGIERRGSSESLPGGKIGNGNPGIERTGMEGCEELPGIIRWCRLDFGRKRRQLARKVRIDQRKVDRIVAGQDRANDQGLRQWENPGERLPKTIFIIYSTVIVSDIEGK